MVRIELTADRGTAWADQLAREAQKPAERDLLDDYMASPVNSPDEVSDAIQWLFEALFHLSLGGPVGRDAFEQQRQRASGLDPRVLTDHMLVNVDARAPKVNLFGA